MAGKQEIRTTAGAPPIGAYSQGLVVGDKEDFAAFNEVYQSYFTRPYPVRTTVGSDPMDILVEIDFVAYAGR
ncbi:RidA family protein [Microbispora bryophytorum]|uniref:RidA family protein n=1 Tax=Microbispora bryophytorum TaxID=1460882 RepID=UPI0037126512